MKNYAIAVFFTLTTLFLGGCATQGVQQRQVMVPGQQHVHRAVAPEEKVSSPKELCRNGRGWQDIGTCNSNSGVQIPVGQIMQAGSGIGNCELVGGGVGAVGGALIGGKEHRGVGAILGAIVGAFAGNKYCESERQAQQTVPQQLKNRCGEGKIWGKLAWPGHPQDGNMVCMAPDDPQRADGNSTQQEKVASAQSSRCKDGKVWAKLTWSGHPQDGQFVCMASDDPHKGN